MRKVLVLVLFLFSASALAAELPVEAFFKNPEFAQVQISPDGDYFAVVAPIQGRRNLVVLEASTFKARPVTNLGPDQTDIAGYTWVSNDRLVYNGGNRQDPAYGSPKYAGIDLVYNDYREVSDRTVDSHIRNLRKKIAGLGLNDEVIHTIYSVGYKFEPPAD